MILLYLKINRMRRWVNVEVNRVGRSEWGFIVE